ncbi:MAG: hypothetical protein HY748_04740 [Elusimicrobia bacterium]|nr:hypothetical protein [Elusimicrobiota bacterium]
MSLAGARLIYWLCRLLFSGKRADEAFTRFIYFGFKAPGTAAVIAKNLSRIYRHALRREPTVAETESVLQEMAVVHARITISMVSPPEAWPRWLNDTSVDLLPVLKGLLEKGKGVILATPHFGNHAYFDVLSALGIPLNLLLLHGTSYESAATRRTLMRLWDVGSSAAGLLRALAANETVLLFDDLDYFPDGRTKHLFGAPFPPPHGPARLSLASGAPVLPVYSVLEGSRWHLVCEEPIFPEAASQSEIEDRLLRSMERRIATRPGHWILYNDVWDLEAVSREMGRQLAFVRLKRWLRSLIGG